MASIANEKNGHRRIQFRATDGKRKTIRLGKVSKRTAEAIKIKVEDLASSAFSGHAPSDETSRWVAELNDTLRAKLEAVGLIAGRESATLQAFLEGYRDQRSDVKASTQTFYRHTRRNLIEFFGPDKSLRDITPGDADRWRLSLIEQGLADNTVRRRCSMAKQFFRAAERRKLIPSNPFVDLKGSVVANRERFHFVDRATAQKVLDACPDAQWRLLFALSRYGGLRCPSEHLSLRWGDVDWEHDRITVPSPKTEHHAGGASRVIPIFPELRPFLDAVWSEPDDSGSEFLITRYRNKNANLRTQLLRIIRRAGVEPWPKLFQNLRSTRQTELAEEFPSHVVCAWIGNSQPVAEKHYLQVTDDHFRRASVMNNEAAQNAAQQPRQMARKREKPTFSAHEKNPDFQGFAGECKLLHTPKVGDTGLEPVTPSLSS